MDDQGTLASSAAAGIAGYQEFLAARDGEPNGHALTLARREDFFQGLARAPVRATTPIDRDAYLRNLRRRRIEDGLDARVLWLLATAKVNQAERFTVGLMDLYGMLVPDPPEPLRTHVYLQEAYHTRMLADVVAMFDLPSHAGPPPLPARMIAMAVVSVPERWRLPLVCCGEMVGCRTMQMLRDRGVELFAGEPQVVERLRVLYDEILADEASHAGFAAARLGAVGRRMARALYRALSVRMASQLPELVALFGREGIVRELRRPFRLQDLVEEFPGRAYAAALI